MNGARSKAILAMAAALAGVLATTAALATEDQDPVAKAVTTYFEQCFKDLKMVADTNPTTETFRREMKTVAEKTKGFFGGTLIDTNFVIAEVYFKRDALARGYDLKKVRELDSFWKKMRAKPEPQLSEPGHGNLLQPRLVAMRYPFLTADGRLRGIVSMMVRTESFLKATKLDECSAFQIEVDNKTAEEQGKLSAAPREIRLSLPSTEWMIRYDK
jgi:hypothetical protein